VLTAAEQKEIMRQAKHMAAARAKLMEKRMINGLTRKGLHTHPSLRRLEAKLADYLKEVG